MDRINELILTAGPSITDKEVHYATDAAAHGWNYRMSGYLDQLEATFARYIGVRHAMATSSCTGALHLGLIAMKIGKGDEVIVPETTWVATANVVRYMGATPIFADIEPDTLVMDVNKVAALITEKTRAIIPVHLYGHPVDMDGLKEVIQGKDIKILEDAAPSLGSRYKGRPTGGLGDAGCFSFQGAKIAAVGEGGIFVTDDTDLFERALYYNRTAVDKNRPLYCTDVGYKYRMANIQAALALAQAERIEELVEKKRLNFQWYKERLGELEEILLNVERPWARNNYWLTNIILGNSVPESRDEFMAKLRERNIDCRPAFHPLSSLPMYDQADNSVAYSIPMRGINLPSGHNLTEEEIHYICCHIRDLLKKAPGAMQAIRPGGWLAWREKTNTALQKMKDSRQNRLPVTKDGRPLGSLVPLTHEDVADAQNIERLAEWRERVKESWPTQFVVTKEGTRQWLQNQVLATKDRILFWVQDNEGQIIGHMGLFRFNYQERSCEIDNVIRGEKEHPGLMTLASQTLVQWAIKTLGCRHLYVRTLLGNTPAIKLYERLGFKEILRVPLKRIKTADGTAWIEFTGQPYQETDRYAVTLKLIQPAG